VVSQFVQPRGGAGRLAGWEMALRPSNRRRNAWAVELLDVRPPDRILEIGFGPGIAVRQLARRATAGLVCGLDHSAVMVRHASRRNRALVRAGRVDLRLGSVLDVGQFEEPFDKVLAVNNFGMWPDPDAWLLELRRVLRGGGSLAIVAQPRSPGADAGTTDRIAGGTATRLRDAGYVELRTEILALDPPVACVLGVAPGGG
jgi:SAM-dependent methyltransferase